MSNVAKGPETIFGEAIEIESAEARASYLDTACGDDLQLRQDIERLVMDHFRAGRFLEGPAATIDHPGPERPGAQIGPYKLLQTIGEGGMGVVYRAEQKQPVKRRVALKIIKPGMDTSQVIARFEAERQALALMDHPNIAKVLDAGTTESGRPYFVMELVNGLKITEYCDGKHLTTKERLALFIPICQAIQHAHQKGVIHRDLKPSNILVALYDGQPVPKVIDFGVAKATSQTLTEKTLFTQLGQIVGTLEYMSPEQAERNQLDIDTRSDVYSLGVVLYELLTGSTPFEGSRLRAAAFDEMLRIIREEEPPRPSYRLSSIETLPSVAASRRIEPRRLTTLIRGELDWIVMKSLEKDRGRRYETANNFAADIERYLNNEAVVACPPSAMYWFRKFARRNKAVLAAASIIACAVLLGLAGTTWQAIRATFAEGVAQDEADRANNEAQRADDKSRALEHQLAKSTVRRLAAQSQSIRQGQPRMSLILAIEAFKYCQKRQLESVMPVAHENLLNATPVVGGTPLVGHGSLVRGLAMSPKSPWLVTADDDGSVRLWNLAADDPASSPRVLTGNQRGFTAVGVAISPDGKLLATGSSGDFDARLWDLTADLNRPLAVLRGHSKRITCVNFSPDGRWLATASWDHTARLWDLTAERPEASEIVLNGHRNRVWDAVFSPNGDRLATASEDRTARLWDLTAENPETSAIVLQHGSGGVAFSPSGRWLATSSWVDNMARLWDLSATDLPSSFKVLAGHKDKVNWPLFSPDGRWLVTGSWDKTARLWRLTSEDPASSQVVLRGHEQLVGAYAFSPDSRWLATSVKGNNTGRLCDLHADDIEDSAVVYRGEAGGMPTLAISPDGSKLILGGGEPPRIWDISTRNPSASSFVLRGHENRITSVAITPDNRLLVTGSWDGTARVWDLSAADPSATAVVLPGIGSAAWGSLAISPDGNWLATGSNDTAVKLWDLRAEDISASLRNLRDHEGAISSLAISADGRWLVTGGQDQTARVWDLAGNLTAPQFVLQERGEVVWLVAISPGGRWLITVSGDSNATNVATMDVTPRLWDLHAANPATSETPLRGHDKAVMSIAISPDGHWAVTGSQDRTARLWDLRSADPAASSKLLPDHLPWTQVAFSPDSRWIVTGDVLRDLAAEDIIASSHKLRARTGRSVRGGALSFSADSRWLARGSQIWDLTAENLKHSSLTLHGHDAGVSSVAISPDGRWVATGSDDNTARLWLLDTDALLQRARRLAGRELTAEEKKRYFLESEDDQPPEQL